MGYTEDEIEIQATETSSAWLKKLRDGRARAAIASRVRRLAFGNAGDVKPVGEGVSELRILIRAGYRVYFLQRGAVLVVLLCGGDKSTQGGDISTAKALAKEIE